MSGNLSGNFQPLTAVVPCVWVTINITSPTIKAAQVPAARQIPPLTCCRNSVNRRPNISETIGPAARSIVRTTSGASKKNPTRIPPKPTE